eukprot:CAMPEP_0170612696 /NCGR_PEP_ID=MMETSP0224-20130122/23864_1 /TAXON_ID=285029 /ORGANISM="Togula jolla, Strain CCCM 725" /LENGTH=92 /DNA_ID=CAMNT_0010938223 /DNA_START=162 /DNA_END=440 /DNA_ORIENTATION=+
MTPPAAPSSWQRRLAKAAKNARDSSVKLLKLSSWQMMSKHLRWSASDCGTTTSMPCCKRRDFSQEPSRMVGSVPRRPTRPFPLAATAVQSAM